MNKFYFVGKGAVFKRKMLFQHTCLFCWWWLEIKVQTLYLHYKHYRKVLQSFNLSSRVCFSLLFMLEGLHLNTCMSYHQHERQGCPHYRCWGQMETDVSCRQTGKWHIKFRSEIINMEIRAFFFHYILKRQSTLWKKTMLCPPFLLWISIFSKLGCACKKIFIRAGWISRPWTRIPYPGLTIVHLVVWQQLHLTPFTGLEKKEVNKVEKEVEESSGLECLQCSSPLFMPSFPTPSSFLF